MIETGCLYDGGFKISMVIDPEGSKSLLRCLERSVEYAGL